MTTLIPSLLHFLIASNATIPLSVVIISFTSGCFLSKSSIPPTVIPYPSIKRLFAYQSIVEEDPDK